MRPTGNLHLGSEQQPTPRGEILVGDAAFRLRRNPDTTVGIDLAYVSAEMAAQTYRLSSGVVDLSKRAQKQ